MESYPKEVEAYIPAPQIAPEKTLFILNLTGLLFVVPKKLVAVPILPAVSQACALAPNTTPKSKTVVNKRLLTFINI